MNRSYRFIVLASIIIIAIFFINAEKSVKGDDLKSQVSIDSLKSPETANITRALKIPNNLNFAGEKVELNKTDIRERIDRELLVNTYWQSNALLWFKRTNKYFPVIEPILKAKGVPDDFKYLSVIESEIGRAHV